MKNFKLVIEYDGTAYQGWQRQKDGSTVQGTIEAALETMIGHPVTVIGSGRTDAGVHALNQVANFRADTRLSPEIFNRGLNSLLPPDIVVKDCAAVNQAFHARYRARSKVYSYRILNRSTRAALFRQYAWHIEKPLDLNAMSEAMQCLKGQRDFSAFEATGSPRSDAVRTVIDVDLTGHEVKLAPKDAEGYVIFTIEADGFLRHMVRNIVGTLVDVGLGKISPGAFQDILMSKDRRQAGITAPAHGLLLKEVRY